MVGLLYCMRGVQMVEQFCFAFAFACLTLSMRSGVQADVPLKLFRICRMQLCQRSGTVVCTFKR
jgi:hypothetical protein